MGYLRRCTCFANLISTAVAPTVNTRNASWARRFSQPTLILHKRENVSKDTQRSGGSRPTPSSTLVLAALHSDEYSPFFSTGTGGWCG